MTEDEFRDACDPDVLARAA
jgi:RNA-directed DNA polymerase